MDSFDHYSGNDVKNKFCNLKNIENETDVRELFLVPLLNELGYTEDFRKADKKIPERNIGKGRRSKKYRPDYVCYIDEAHQKPVLVIDTKSPNEDAEGGVEDAQLYAAVIRRRLEKHKLTQFCVGSNAVKTVLKHFESDRTEHDLKFRDFQDGNPKFEALKKRVSRTVLKNIEPNEDRKMKVVIPSAGLGTNLLPATKEQPKEMLPIFSNAANDDIGAKPLLQLVFEQLYEAGFREFCFIIGREKRSIPNHFTPDHKFLSMLKDFGKNGQATDLEDFYGKINTSTIIWVNQPVPKGFGDAVLMAQSFVQNEIYLVHAGDTYIISKDMEHIRSLISTFERLRADAAFIVQEIKNPRQFGVIEAEEIENGIYKVKAAMEKPEKPPTNLAIVPIYIFHPVIFKALEKTPPGKGGEIQLTDAIQKLIEWGLNVYAVKLNQDHVRLDIGSPETYWEALSLSYKLSKHATSASKLIRTSQSQLPKNLHRQ